MWRVAPTFRGVHPRSRGENERGPACPTRQSGSSPLTRGKPAIDGYSPYVNRLIPAHAGKTMSSRPASMRSPAHPRSRGENPSIGPALASAIGSSPLTRGKRGCGRGRARRGRLIPAHAGKTSPAGRPRRGSLAHPRSRGETSPLGHTVARAGGSSPLTRGKPPRQALIAV